MLKFFIQPHRLTASFKKTSLILVLAAVLSVVLAPNMACATDGNDTGPPAAQGLNAVGNSLPIGAGGSVEMTVNAPVAPAKYGTVNFTGPIVEGGTTINADGSTTIGSNNGAQSTLTVNGNVNIGTPSSQANLAVAGTIKSSTQSNYYEVLSSLLNSTVLAGDPQCDVNDIVNTSFYCTSGCSRWCRSVNGYSSGVAVEMDRFTGLVACACLP